MRVQIKLDVGRFVEGVGRYSKQEVSDCRNRFVKRLMRTALQKTIQENPVDTGRSRGSWVQSLEQLGGVPIAGWTGDSAVTGAISEGRAAGRLVENESDTVSEIRVSSDVEYVVYLEFGTRRMSPFQMVRQGLMAARRNVRSG